MPALLFNLLTNIPGAYLAAMRDFAGRRPSEKVEVKTREAV
jgi:hypothetical protein